MAYQTRYPSSVTQPSGSAQTKCPGIPANRTGCYDWVNLGNIKANNGNVSHIPPSGGVSVVSGDGIRPSPLITCSNYGFDIPKNSSIDGVEVIIKKRNNVSYNGIKDRIVRLRTSSSNNSSNAADGSNWPTSGSSFRTSTYGSESNKWGFSSSLTPPTVNASSFGVEFQCVGTVAGKWCTPAVDYIAARVYYTAPTYSISSSLPGTAIVGQEVIYSVSFSSNKSITTTTNINVPTPAGLTFVEHGLTNGSYSGGVWKISSGTGGTLNIRFRCTAAGSRTVRATIADTGKYVDKTIAISNPTFSLSNSISKTQLYVNEQFTYTSTCSTNGFDASKTVYIDSPGLQIVSQSGNGTYTQSNKVWGAVFSNKTATKQITFRATQAGSYYISNWIDGYGAVTRYINVLLPDQPKPPEPEEPEPPEPPGPDPALPREETQISVEDGTSVEIPYLVVTDGDELEKPIEDEDPEISVDPAEMVSITSKGPRAVPLNTSGIFTITVKNISEQPVLHNVRIDIGSDIDVELFERILQKQETPILTSEGYILISELKDEFKFNLEFRHNDVITFNTLFNIFNQTLHEMEVKIKDLPYLIMDIEGPSETDIDEEFDLIYTLRNPSQIDALDVETLIDIPKQFNILDIQGDGFTRNGYEISWNHDLIESESSTIQLKVTLSGRGKGTYRFKFAIIDGEVFLNEIYHMLDVGIYPITSIIPNVDKRKLEVDEILILTTRITNTKKISKNTNLLFDLDDYELMDIDVEDGIFDETNMKWYIGDLGIGYDSKIILTLKAKTPGDKTFTIQGYRQTDKLFQTKKVYTTVFEKTPKFLFNVTQSTDIGYVDEEEYYTIEIKNIEDESLFNCVIENIIPPQLEVLRSDNSEYDIITNTLTVDEIEANDSVSFKLYVKILEKGEISSIFSFKADKTNLEYRILTMRCADEYIYENLRHSIKIFNFDKLNKYCNLRISEQPNLIKTFNKENLTERIIDIEKYLVDRAEVYEGGNLRKIVDDINDNSIYVKSEFMRKGLNILRSDVYDIYPDGFIRRFGLLRSDIFHATGVIPKIINMSDYAMRWDIDNWNEKVWAGDIWDNGVFQAAIMYTDIPTNFIIPDYYELQAIINKAKPFGTKGMPFYMAREKFKMGMNLLSAKVEPRVYTELEKLRFKDPYCKMQVFEWDNDIDDLKLVYGYFDPIDYKLRMKLDAKFKGVDITNPNVEPSIKTTLDDKIRFKPVTSKGLVDVGDVKFNTINDYKSSISSDNLKNIDLNKILDLSTIDPINTNDIIMTIPEEPILSFDNAPKYPITDMFGDFDTIVVKIDSDIIDNSEFGLYISDGDEYVRFCRNKNIINGENGIKLVSNQSGLEETLYSNVLPETEEIYLKLEKVDDVILFYYSFDGLSFNFIKEFIMNFNFKRQGIYVINKNLLDNPIEYKCYEIKKVNSNTTQVYQVIQDDIKTSKSKINEVTEIKDDLEWQGFSYINNDVNSYAKCENNTILEGQNVSPVIIGFDDINISDLDEVTKIDIKVKTHSNTNIDSKTSLSLNGNSYIPTEKATEIKYPQNVDSIRTISANKKWQNIEGSLQSNLNNTYCTSQFGTITSEWIEYNNFKFNIDGTHEETILNIEGVNKSNNPISCRVQMISKGSLSKIYVINNINPGNFEKQLRLTEIFSKEEINNDSFGFKLQFSNIKRDSQIELSQINSKITYNKKVKTIPLFEEVAETIIPKTSMTKWTLLSSDNLWNLKNQKPYHLNGYDIKNKILAFIDFGSLEPEEYVRLYSVEIIIYYKNTYGEFISGTIPNKVATVIYEGGDVEEIPIYKVSNNTTYNVAQIAEETSDIEDTTQSVTFKNKLLSVFTTDSTKISFIEFDIRRSGFELPNNLEFKVYESIEDPVGSENYVKGNLVSQKTINNWIVNDGIGSFELDIDVDNDESYWFEIDLPYKQAKNYVASYQDGKLYISSSIINSKIDEFKAVSNEISQLKYDIIKSHQAPLNNFTIKIYDTESNRPGELLYEKKINEWDSITSEFGIIDINLENIVIDDKYWIELLLPFSKRDKYKISWINNELHMSLVTQYNNMFGYGMDISSDRVVIEQNEYDRPLVEITNQGGQDLTVRKEGIDFKYRLYQQFEATNTNISAIEFQTAGRSGFPSRYITLEILEDTGSNKPGKSIKKQFIEGWTGITTIKYSISVDNLVIGERYWIKLSVPKLDNKNYYTIRYKEGIVYQYGKLSIQEGNQMIDINSGDASLAFKIYTSNQQKSVNKVPIYDEFNNDIIIKNRLRRKNGGINIKSYNTMVKYGKER